MITAINRTCHTIDLFGDGPYWEDGQLMARMTDSGLHGVWTFEVSDPGATGPPGVSIPATRFSLVLNVHQDQ
jgi:hypothetical protein